MKYNYLPSVKEVRTSLKHRSKQFLLENTLHGVPYFVDSSRPKWERIIWFLLTAASLGATIAVIVTIWDKFQTEPTMTELDTNTEEIIIDFPQIYICYDWNELNHSYLPKSEMYLYEQLYNWEWGQSINLEPSDITHGERNNFREILGMIGPDCNLLFNNCTYRNIEEPCNKLFTKVLVPLGACCRFDAPKPLKVDDISSLSFDTTLYPWRLNVVEKFVAQPKRNERALIKAYEPLEIRFMVSVTYSTADLRHLTRRQRQCHYQHEGPSLNDCEMNCLMDEIYRDCNCLPWFLLSPDKEECTISKYPCLKHSNFDVEKCNCRLSCNHTSFGVRLTARSIKGNLIRMSKWPEAVFKREIRFGYLDLLVSFGGIASSFLGYSLLTSVEFSYYFSLRTYCGAVLESSRKKHNIVTVRVIEAKPPCKVDVNPLYYDYVD